MYACCCRGDENGDGNDDGDIGPRSELEDLCMDLGPRAMILFQGSIRVRRGGWEGGKMTTTMTTTTTRYCRSCCWDRYPTGMDIRGGDGGFRTYRPPSPPWPLVTPFWGGLPSSLPELVSSYGNNGKNRDGDERGQRRRRRRRRRAHLQPPRTYRRCTWWKCAPHPGGGDVSAPVVWVPEGNGRGGRR